MSKSELTPKQQRWLEEYLSCWNATEAARKAGYSNTRVSGHRNITNDNIRAEIDARLTELGMSADEVIARLADQARGDVTDFFKVDSMTGFISFDMKKAQELGKMHLIKKMKFNKSGFLESIELHDPQAALVHLGKVHGIFIDRSKQDIDIEIVIDDKRDEIKRRIRRITSTDETRRDIQQSIQ